jgi:hypothetical protein
MGTIELIPQHPDGASGPIRCIFVERRMRLCQHQSAMRLWTIHPKHLDAKGLVALWREALLAQKVLQGRTRGYRHHPQLLRFQATRRPAAALAAYLAAVHEESVRRGYRFDASKIGRVSFRGQIPETKSQLLHEWNHLKWKLARRDPERFLAGQSLAVPQPHPLFRIIPGKVRSWEKAPSKSGPPNVSSL